MFKKNGVEYIKGFGKVSGPNGVDVALNDEGSRSISASNIVIATGSEVTPLPPVPVDNDKFKIVDSTGALSLPEVPEKMVVVGGGLFSIFDFFAIAF